MLSSKFIGIATFMYVLCMVLYFCYLFFRNKKFSTMITGVAIISLIFHTTGLGLRWYESYQVGYGHIPLSNLYEALDRIEVLEHIALKIIVKYLMSPRWSEYL